MFRGLIQLVVRALGVPGRHHSVGARGEAAAAVFLREKGYSILARNVWMNFGEADLVARDPGDVRGPTLVVVEVKARVRRADVGGKSGEIRPEASVTARKKAKLRRLASALAEANGGGPRRVDVIAVEYPMTAPGVLGEPTIRHFVDAVRGR